jgi:hypothetical protein
MKRWIKLIATIAVMISIPLQGLAGTNMPLCTNQASHVASMSMGSTSTNTAMPDSIGQALPDKNCQDCCGTQSSNNCPGEKCFTCHISMIQIPVKVIAAAPPIVVTRYPDLIKEHYETLTPALFHPPKLLLT